MNDQFKRNHPWIAEFKDSPEAALNDLLQGCADISPYERVEAVDILEMFFSGFDSTHEFRKNLDLSLCSWLKKRYRDNPEVRLQRGLNCYVYELIQGFSTVYRLRLPTTADYLSKHFVEFQRWLEPLYIDTSRDAGGELWRIMALMQKDRRRLNHWYRLCEEAGKTFPENYLSIGLLGLRLLPEDNKGAKSSGLSKELMVGLFKWGSGLEKNNETDKQNFILNIRTIRSMFPRTPEEWRELMEPLLYSKRSNTYFLKGWLENAGFEFNEAAKSKGSFKLFRDCFQDTDSLKKKINDINIPITGLLDDIDSLIAKYEENAEAGYLDDLVIGGHQIGNSLLTRGSQYAERSLKIALTANRWQPSNSFAWTLWADSLYVLGKIELAEAVYWETIRRFPEVEVCRNMLANFFARTNRTDKAEKINRETMKRFPLNAVCRHGLAHLLIQKNNADSLKEVEGLLREAKKLNKKPGKDVFYITSLANFLVVKKTQKDMMEAEELLEKALKLEPQNVKCINSLAILFTRKNIQGGKRKAEELLKEALLLEPGNVVCHTALANLMASIEDRKEEARKMFKDIIDRFKDNLVCRVAYAFRLIHWKEIKEAKELCDNEIFDKLWEESKYVRMLHEALEKNKNEVNATLPDINAALLEEANLSQEPSAANEYGYLQVASGVPLVSPLQAESGIITKTSRSSNLLEEPHVEKRNGMPANADIYASLKDYKIVSEADFCLRTSSDDKVKKEAEANIKNVLHRKPNHIYAHLVLAFHNGHCNTVVEQIDAFPCAYPLRFIVARQKKDAEEWDKLECDFNGHKYFNLIGRLMSVGEKDFNKTAATLYKWCKGAVKEKKGFIPFIKKQLESTLFKDMDKVLNKENLPHNIRKYATEIDTLTLEGLKRAVDENLQYSS